MTEKERMLSGKLYCGRNNPELVSEVMNARRLTRAFNATTEEELERRTQILTELFGAVGKNIFIEPTFRCDYGYNIKVGDNFFANFDCVMLDVSEISIGNDVFFAPRVCLFTATHPIDAEIRNANLQYGKPIKIGNDVWIGGNTVVNPGVSVGNNVVIGSGSVVTKDIPDNSVAAGNPCRVLRRITQADKDYWNAERAKYEAEIGILK